MPPLKKVTNEWSRYAKADQPPKPRIIGLSVGEVGTGKTHFWLGAPGPIVVFSFDKGLEGVVEPFQSDKDIYVSEYDWSPTEDLDQEEAIALRDKFCEDFEHAIQHARTVLIDKETDLWELFRYAEFGAPNDSPRNYPQLNQRYRKYINMPKATEINFGCVAGLKDEWVRKINRKTGAEGAGASGNRIRAGFSELDGLVHINLFHTREKSEEASGAIKPCYWIEVGKARGPGGFDVQDQRFENLSFSDFGQLVFPGTGEEEWV